MSEFIMKRLWKKLDCIIDILTWISCNSIYTWFRTPGRVMHIWVRLCNHQAAMQLTLTGTFCDLKIEVTNNYSRSSKIPSITIVNRVENWHSKVWRNISPFNWLRSNCTDVHCLPLCLWGHWLWTKYLNTVWVDNWNVVRGKINNMTSVTQYSALLATV